MLSISNTTGGTLTASTPITFTQDFNSNGNVTFNGSVATINKAGKYIIDVDAILTATGTTTGIQLYANGTALPKTLRSLTTASGDSVELTINTSINVGPVFTSTDKLQLTIVPTAGATLVNAQARIVEVR